MNRRRAFVICWLFYCSAGCSTAPVQKADIFLEAKNIKAAASEPFVQSAPPVEELDEPATININPPAQVLSVLPDHERFVYKAKFLGFTIGRFIITNDGKTLLNNREVYRFELTVKTAAFFTILFKPKERYVSYLDAENFVIMRHEEYIDGGTSLESFVDFDHQSGTAFYKNIINHQQKSMPIPEKIFDTLTLYFYLRMIPLELGDTIQEYVYFEHKIYEFVGLLESRENVNMPADGERDAYFLKPYVFKDGAQVTKISAEVYLSTGAPKVTLRAVLKSPFGNVSVYLDEE